MIGPDDEFRHPAPPDAAAELWGDTLWVSLCDPRANVFGILHFHLTNKGYARFESLCVIDGVQQLYGNKVPLPVAPDRGPWSDGRLTYTVVRPLEEIRITFDGPRYAFDLRFVGRFPVFDYADSIHGNPLLHFHSYGYGGHYEQGLACTGTFEIRGGPAKGQVRQIDCFGHRDHSWSTRFAEEPPWAPVTGNIPGHFWPSIQLPDRHINAFGVMAPESFGLAKDDSPIGGFVASVDGVKPLRGATAEVLFEDDQRTAAAFRFALTMPDGKVVHARTTRKYGQVKLWDRGENDLENRLDCYEPFFDFEIEETGERGTGVAEYSVQPPWPRWLV
jgi:hypothetical protein